MTTPGRPTSADVEEAQNTQRADEVEALATTVPVFWPQDRPRFRVNVMLQESADGFDCVGFAVTALQPGTSIGAANVRDLPVATLVRTAIHKLLTSRAAVYEQARSTPPETVTTFEHGSYGTITVRASIPDDEFVARRDAYFTQEAERISSRIGRPAGMGRGRRYPPGHLEEVARIVREARRARESTQQRVAEVFGITRTAAANQISRARARGLLDDTREDDQ